MDAIVTAGGIPGPDEALYEYTRGKPKALTGRAILCPYAEVGMDADKPHQLEMLRAELARRSAP